MHLWEISISSLNNVIIRPTKIRYPRSPSQIFFTEKKSERFGWFLMPKNDFESTNFANFEEVVHNFGKSDDDMIYWKNAYFH